MADNDIQALLAAAVDAILIIDNRGRISAFNRSAERLFGYAATEVLGQNVSLLMPDPWRTEHDGYLERYARTGIPHIIGVGREVEALCKDGSILPVALSVGRVEGSDPARFVGFIRDLTVERQARAAIQTERDHAISRRREEQHARTLQERLTHVSRMATMGEMAAGIAHELNQPLSAIATYARACERFLQAADPDLPETLSSLREISGEALRAGEIIRRLRQLVTTRPSDHVRLTLNELVGDLSVLVNADARIHKTQIAIELGQELPPILADRTQLQQMVLSLVRNSLEAMTDSTMSERHVIIRTGLIPDGRLELSVSDNGPGISVEIADRLFTPFLTTKTNGTGLGLAISQTIAQAHGGTLAYRPNQPAGACFFVRLPAAEDV